MTLLSEHTDYAYAVGRIRALECKLLDRPSLVRLLDEPLPGVCRILEEHGYPQIGEICGGMPEDRAESFISEVFADFKDQCLANCFKELAQLSVHPEITSLLPLRYDCLNLGWILKAKAAKEKTPRLFRCGTVAPDVLERMVAEEGVDLTGLLKEAYDHAFPLIEAGADVRLIGCRTIAAYWRHFLRVARASGLEFLRLLATYHIDGVNLSTLVRLKHDGEASLSRLEEELVPAPAAQNEPGAPIWEPVGLEPLSKEFYRRAWGESVEMLSSLLGGTHYERASIEAMSGGTFDSLVFDKELDNLIAKLAREARVATFGVEPLFAYGIAREVEVSNLKILLGGRGVGLKVERIQEELRYGYV